MIPRATLSTGQVERPQLVAQGVEQEGDPLRPPLGLPAPLRSAATVTVRTV